jgi:hypothetical protein
MRSNETFRRHARVLLAGLVLGASLLNAAEDITTPAATAASTTTSTNGAQTPSDEIAQLRALLAAQQKQLESLQHAVERQQKLLDKEAASASIQQTLRPNLGSVASTTPTLPLPAAAMPAVPAYPAPRPQAASTASSRNPCEAPPDGNAVPPYLRLGNTCIVPIGFMDASRPSGATRTRDRAWVPTSAAFPITTRSTATSRNSVSLRRTRVSVFRVDGDWKGAHFIGYNEFDFNGTSGSNGSPFRTARLCPAFACSGSTSAKARSSSSPARAGVC